MNIASIARAAGRRWYVLLLGLFMTAGLAYFAFQIVPVTYDVRASFLLIPPLTDEKPTDDNPFLHLGGLDIAAGVLAASLNDGATMERLAPKDEKGEYFVQPDDSVAGSVLEVVATGRSSAQAFEILNGVLAVSETRLVDLQDSVHASPSSQITMMVITDNTVAKQDTSTMVRILIMVAVGGLALTGALAVAVDSIVRRVKSRDRTGGTEKPRGKEKRRGKKDQAAEPVGEQAPVPTPDDVPQLTLRG